MILQFGLDPNRKELEFGLGSTAVGNCIRDLAKRLIFGYFSFFILATNYIINITCKYLVYVWILLINEYIIPYT